MFSSNSRHWLCTPSKKISWEIIISKVYLPFPLPVTCIVHGHLYYHGLIKYHTCLLTFGLTTISFYPAKYTCFVLSIFSSLPMEFIVTATFQCLFQSIFSRHKPVSQSSMRRPSSGKAQSSGVQPRTTIAAKRRFLSTGTRQSGKVQESRSKLVLFVTMTTEKMDCSKPALSEAFEDWLLIWAVHG